MLDVINRSLLIIGIIALTSCSTANDRLNEKLVGETTDQRLSTLKNECSVVSTSNDKKLPDSHPSKLTQLCSGMEQQIKAMSVSLSGRSDDGNETFDALYERCVNESKVKNTKFRQTYNPVRPSIPSGPNYDYKAKAVCDAYKDMWKGL